MDAFFFHPKLVHLPISLALLMPLLSAGLLWAWTRGVLPRRAWVIAVALQALLVASGIAAMRSGENEEDRVEKIVRESLIEEHEEAAEAFVWTAGGVLLLFLAASVLPWPVAARRFGAAATAGSLVVLFLGYRTGEAGGRLVYEHGAAQAYVTAAAPAGGAADAGGDRHGDDEVEDDDD